MGSGDDAGLFGGRDRKPKRTNPPTALTRPHKKSAPVTTRDLVAHQADIESDLTIARANLAKTQRLVDWLRQPNLVTATTASAVAHDADAGSLPDMEASESSCSEGETSLSALHRP